MRAAIYLVVTAVSLFAGCRGTHAPTSNDTNRATHAGPADVPNLLGQGRSFFGIALGDGAKNVVFVIDRSGSMTCTIDYVKFELKRSIRELDEADEFHVVFYSSGPPLEMPTRRLVNATEWNKQLAFEFVDGIFAQGETDPSKALEQAFAVGPELIYLLTDGEFDRSVVNLVKRLNADKCVMVHTIGFLYRTGEEVLKKIAEQNGGTYRFVAEADLAHMFPP